MKLFCYLLLTCRLFFLAGLASGQNPTNSAGLTGVSQIPVTVSPFDIANEAIVRNLDSLVSVRFFKKENTATSRLPNKYGYAPDYIPPLSDSVISWRMRQIQSPIPLKHNPYVRGFIEMYAIRKKSLTERVLALSKYYYPEFEAALERHGMPHQLKHLAVVESALNPNAVSKVGASGLWQFMYRTGMQYGLKVNYYSDERRDPGLSSDAACRFMKDLYYTYNDWLLVLAAYNCGPGNVNRAIRRSGGKTTFWEIMPYLPAETRGYVPAFIAVTYLMTYPSEHNLQPFSVVALPIEIDTVAVQGPLPLSYFAQMLNMDSDLLALMNPQLKQKFVPAGYPEYILRIPARLAPEFERRRSAYLAYLYDMTRSKAIAEKAVEANARLAQPDSTNFPYSTWKYHKVRRGDNLSNIARKYGVSGSQIKELNQLKSNRLVVGIRLKIQRNPVHAVKPVQVDTLNQQTGGLVHVKNAADSLVLAESGSPKSTAPKNSSMQVDPTQQGEKQAKSYRVRQGDTLWSISRKFQGLTVEQLMKLNNLTSSSRLTPGMVLRIQLG
jgi:membrane-bound lytic murein transglycosylase D